MEKHVGGQEIGYGIQNLFKIQVASYQSDELQPPAAIMGLSSNYIYFERRLKFHTTHQGALI